MNNINIHSMLSCCEEKANKRCEKTKLQTAIKICGLEVC